MIKGKIDEIFYREVKMLNKITIWDIFHKQAECTVTKHIYGSKFEKKFQEKNENENFRAFFENPRRG